MNIPKRSEFGNLRYGDRIEAIVIGSAQQPCQQSQLTLTAIGARLRIGRDAAHVLVRVISAALQVPCRLAPANFQVIIKWPGGAKGAVVNGLHYNLDWGPTLMDLLCGQKPAKWQGQSYSQTVLTGKEKGREQLVLSQCAHVCQRSVRWDKWLYMRTYHDGFHLFPKEMLFDVVADPHEQHDLAEKHPEVCREGAARLANWHDEQMQTMAVDGPDVADPLWTVYREGGPFHARHAAPSPLPKYLKRLEETGRADKAQLLREKYAKWL